MSHTQDLSRLIQNRSDEFISISDDIWGFAESRFQEFRSFERQAAYMEQEGFRVKRGIAGEDTAFTAEYGSGKPVIALLGEYDALSGLSQKADEPCRCPLQEGGDDHG